MMAGNRHYIEILEPESESESCVQVPRAVETGSEDQILTSSRGLVAHWQNFLPKMEDMTGNLNIDWIAVTEVLGWNSRLVFLHGDDVHC